MFPFMIPRCLCLSPWLMNQHVILSWALPKVWTAHPCRERVPGLQKLAKYFLNGRIILLGVTLRLALNLGDASWVLCISVVMLAFGLQVRDDSRTGWLSASIDFPLGL